MSMESYSDNIGNRTRELPVCNAVHHQTAPVRVPSVYVGGGEGWDRQGHYFKGLQNRRKFEQFIRVTGFYIQCTFLYLSPPNSLHTSLYRYSYIYIPLPFHIYHRHFPSPVNTFLTLFLNICHLPWESLITYSGSRFQSAMVLFTKQYFPTSFGCLLALIFHLWSTLLK